MLSHYECRFLHRSETPRDFKSILIKHLSEKSKEHTTYEDESENDADDEDDEDDIEKTDSNASLRESLYDMQSASQSNNKKRYQIKKNTKILTSHKIVLFLIF